MQRSVLCLIIFVLSFSCVSIKTVKKESNDEFNLLSSMVRFYHGPLNHLSAVRRGECPMSPSCSVYAKECIQKHGAFVGWMMACDRLMRCGRNEMKSSSRILVDGKWKYYDPVEKNDFWWSKE